MQHLVVYADYVCPFCYLAELGVARVRAERRVQVEEAPFELYPAGIPQPSPDAEWMRIGWTRQIEPLAAQLGASMRYPVRVPRTRKAHEATAFARSEGRGVEMHGAIYAAYWTEGRDIGRIDVLSQIGGGVGLDPTAVRVALDVDQWTEQVEREEEAARALRLSAVPAYVLKSANTERTLPAAGSIRVGLMRYDELRAWVETQS